MKKFLYSLLIIIPAIFVIKINSAQAVDCCCTGGTINICIPSNNTPCTMAFPNAITDNTVSTCDKLTKKLKETSQQSWAEQFLGGPLIPNECRLSGTNQAFLKKDKSGGLTATECGIGSFFKLMANVLRLMLGVLGSLALLMFIWGGLQYILAGLILGEAQADRINNAKKTLTNAVVGIIIILSAWVIVNFVIVALTQGRAGLADIGRIFGNPWDQPPR